MKRKIRILLIAFCIKKALKFEQCEKMLLKRMDSVDLIYSIGVSGTQHNKWIDRAKKLQPRQLKKKAQQKRTDLKLFGRLMNQSAYG